MTATHNRSGSTSHRLPNKFLVAGLIAVIVGLFAHLSGVTASPASAEQQVKTAWHNANLAESFDFATDLAQTTYPAPALSNVGRSSRTDSMRIEGKVDRPSETIRMSLWSGNGHVLNAGDALELRVVRGAAEGRVSGGDWQAMDNVTNAFAPSGDMLGFLAGARNITRQTVTSSGGQLPTVYTFDIDGPALAEHLRVQLEDQLAAKGELPAGVHLDTPGVYYGAVGSGEVWLTTDGYPTRMTLSLDLPEQANGERVTVHFTSQLSAFQPKHTLASTSNPLAAGVQSVVATLAAAFTPQVNQSLVFSFAFVALCVWLLIRYGRSRRVYAVVAVIDDHRYGLLAVVASRSGVCLCPETKRSRRATGGRAQQPDRSGRP